MQDIRVSDQQNRYRFGPLYGEYFGTLPVLMISDPKLIRQIMVTEFKTFPLTQVLGGVPDSFKNVVAFADQSRWKHLRNSLSPAFSAVKLRRVFEQFEQPMQTFVENVDELIRKGESSQICIKDLCKGFALDSIAKYVCSIELNSFKQPNDTFVRNIWRLVRLAPVPFLLSMTLPSWCGRFVKGWILNPSAEKYFSKLIRTMIRQRQQNPTVRYNDYLQTLMDTDKKITEDEIVGQCQVFFFGGMDTVTTALAIILSDLAHYQDVQERLYEEILNQIPAPDDSLTYDQLNEMTYLHAIMLESLRRTPLFNSIPRVSVAPFHVPEYDLTIEPGINIRLNIFNLHHDPTIYAEPFEYRPERYTGPDRIDLQRRSWLPFSDGPRNCLGVRLAQMKIKYFLVEVIRRYRIRLSPEVKWPIDYEKTIVISIPESLRIEFQRRS